MNSKKIVSYTKYLIEKLPKNPKDCKNVGKNIHQQLKSQEKCI